jgi:hypothetical protein
MYIGKKLLYICIYTAIIMYPLFVYIMPYVWHTVGHKKVIQMYSLKIIFYLAFFLELPFTFSEVLTSWLRSFDVLLQSS